MVQLSKELQCATKQEHLEKLLKLSN